VEANLLALSERNAVGEVYNISLGEASTINMVVKMLQEIMDKKAIEPVYTEPRSADIRHSYADISKARKKLGYEPSIQLDEGLNELVKLHVKN
jgi:nucleoside-diphosphate-sugar epimerase